MAIPRNGLQSAIMAGRERLRRLARPLGQATMYFVFVIAIVEFLRREGVVTHAVFTPRTVLVAVILWLVLIGYRMFRERAAG